MPIWGWCTRPMACGWTPAMPIPTRWCWDPGIRWCGNTVAWRSRDWQELKAAAEPFRQAVARQPELASAHWHRGQLLRQTGRMTEAAELFQRAIQADPQEWRGYVGFGQALLQQGRKSEALAPLERAATLPFWHGRSWRLVIAIAPDGKWRSARARTCRRRWTRGRSGRAPIRLNTRIQLLQKPTKKTKGRHLCAGADRPAGETGRTCVESGFE